MLNELGIYIHIPFCKQKCYYCDFVSYSNKCSEVKEYIESLKKEIEEFDFSNYKVTSIYIGGGTPSYIDSIYIVEILSELKEKLKCNLIEFKDIEITIEVNPGTVDTKKLNDYKKLGINRLSIGLQSTKNDILKKIGRIHTYQELILDMYEFFLFFSKYHFLYFEVLYLIDLFLIFCNHLTFLYQLFLGLLQLLFLYL